MKGTKELFWEVPKHRVFSSHGGRVHHPLDTVVFTNPEALQTPAIGINGGFLTQAWPIINSILSPSPLSRGRGGTEIFKLLIMPWSSWWPPPHRSPPRVASLEQAVFLVLLSLRRFREFQEPCVRSLGGWGGDRDQYIYIFFYYVTHTLSVCQVKAGRKPKPNSLPLPPSVA